MLTTNSDQHCLVLMWQEANRLQLLHIDYRYHHFLTVFYSHSSSLVDLSLHLSVPAASASSSELCLFHLVLSFHTNLRSSTGQFIVTIFLRSTQCILLYLNLLCSLCLHSSSWLVESSVVSDFLLWTAPFRLA